VNWSLRIKELLARANTAEETSAMLRLGELEIDVPRHQGHDVRPAAGFDGHGVEAARDFDPSTRAGANQRPASAGCLGYENPIDSRTVDTHMRRLRGKLGDVARYLETVRGVGYRRLAED